MNLLDKIEALVGHEYFKDQPLQMLQHDIKSVNEVLVQQPDSNKIVNLQLFHA